MGVVVQEPGRSAAHAQEACRRAHTRRIAQAFNVSSRAGRQVCRAVAEAPPADIGLQLDVTFEEPVSPIPTTYITTTARVVASAVLAVYLQCVD